MPTSPAREPSDGAVRVAHLDGTAFVSLTGEIDLALAHELQVALAEAMASDKVVIDLTQATFIDSTTIKALVVAHRAAAATAVTLTVMPGSDRVMRPLRICGVDQLLVKAE